MSGLGLIFIGLGVLTMWSGLNRVIVFDILRSFIGAPVASRESSGAYKEPPKSGIR